MFDFTMNASWPSVLKQHCGKHLFEVRSRIKGAGSTMGFVVDFSDDLILFHVLATDTFRLNGYAVNRTEDVKDYRGFNNGKFWQNRAAVHFKLAPVRPAGILLDSVPQLLTAISKRYPLITIHPEKIKPDVCYIGSLLSMTEATFKIDDLNCNAEWSSPRRLKFSDVTRVDFGGGYEQALAATAPKRPKKKQ
jgi:hypothetical protein